MQKDTLKNKKGNIKRDISKKGKEMLRFQEELAKEHKYKPVPINLFTGNVRDKYEENLPSWCLDKSNYSVPLYSSDGIMICKGFNRIVIGDYGAFIEIPPDKICQESLICKKGQEYRYQDGRYSKNIKYLWLTTKDLSDCKIYLQKKTVAYADYRPDMYYISPYEVFLTARDEA